MTSTLLFAVQLAAASGPADSLRASILERIARDSGAVVAVAARDPVGGFTVLVHPDQRFHAASTMKVPMLIELARRVDAREFAWLQIC